MAIAGLSIRLLLDHHLDPRLAIDLRQYGYDVTYPRELGTGAASDEEHLIWAAERGRAIFTFDVRDFRLLGEQWRDQGRDHAGIILSIAPPRISYGEVLRGLLTFLNAVSAEEMVNQVRWLSDV